MRIVAVIYLVGIVVVALAVGYLAGSWTTRKTMVSSAVHCQLNDGTAVSVDKFIQAHGAFASSTGSCTVKR